MNLENQIALISNPQEYTRLCNAALKALHGHDFLEIDDDRPDRGNDGYLKSEKRMFAGHCFKRLQNQSITVDIRQKMSGDLAKAIQLKQSGDWNIQAWTFLSNYPIPEEIARDILRQGEEAGIDASWSGPGFLAEILQSHPDIRTRFPVLEVNEVIERLASLEGRYKEVESADGWTIPGEYPAPTERDVAELITGKPQGWEYMLFGALMRQGRASLSSRLLDHEVGYAPRSGIYLDEHSAARQLNLILADASRIINIVDSVFSRTTHERAFGALGEAGSAGRIQHIATRVIGCIQDLLDWAVTLRGFGVPDEMLPVFSAAAHLVDQPISEVLQFVDDYSATASRIPELLAAADDAPVHLSQTLTLTMDPVALRNFSQAMQQYESSLPDA